MYSKLLFIIGLIASISFVTQAYPHYVSAEVEASGMEAYEAALGGHVASERQEAGSYYFQLTSDLIRPEKKDAIGNVWHRGFFTENNEVKLGYSSNDSRIASVKMGIMNCNLGFKTEKGSILHVDEAIEIGNNNVEAKTISEGKMESFEISRPGRNTIGYVAFDKNNEVLYNGQVEFDALFDDGKWINCGEAELTSGLLNGESCRHNVGSFSGSFETSIMGNMGAPCSVAYPHYYGESWTVPMDYHPELKYFRIVNPLISNSQLKDYTVKKEETLGYTYTKGEYYFPEAFIFDRDNPSWFLINAADPEGLYNEPTSVGMMMLHSWEGKDYFAGKYHERVFAAKYTEEGTPDQALVAGEYWENPIEKQNSLVNVKFPREALEIAGNSGIVNFGADENSLETYYTLDGYRVTIPSKGVYLKKKGTKVSKVFF